jgi:hypothetical protein
MSFCDFDWRADEKALNDLLVDRVIVTMVAFSYDGPAIVKHQ